MLSLYSWGVQGAEMKALDKAVRVLALESRVVALHLPGFCKSSHSAPQYQIEKQSTTGILGTFKRKLQYIHHKIRAVSFL